MAWNAFFKLLGLDGSSIAKVDTSGNVATATADVQADKSFTTANDYLVLKGGSGYSNYNVSLLGQWTGTIYFEGSNNYNPGGAAGNGNWTATNYHQGGTNAGATINTVTGTGSAGQYITCRGNAGGYRYWRVRTGSDFVATGSVVVNANIGTGTSAVFLNASIPAGTNLMGGTYMVDASGVNKAKVDANGNQYAVVTSPKASAAGVFAYLSPYNTQRVSVDAGTVFVDVFEAALDTTNRWNTPATVTGGSYATGSGNLTLSTTTALSASVSLTSMPTLQPTASYYQVGWVITMEYPLLANTHRFFGVGTQPGSPSATNPLQNAIGFEVDLTGNLNAVMYSNGTKTYSQSMAAYYTSGNPMLAAIVYRGDFVFWYINSQEVPVASAQFQTPQVITLPLHAHLINSATTGPTSGVNMKFDDVAALDSNPSAATVIADGTYGWRKAKVDNAGNLYNTISSPKALAAGNYAYVDPFGSLRVSSDAWATLLHESWDTSGILDLAVRWTQATTTGGGVSQGNGLLTLTTTTAASASAQMVSVPTILPSGGTIKFASTVKIESPVQAHCHRFWGVGVHPGGAQPGTYSATTPLRNAIGFEIDLTGNLNAVVYSAGVKTFSQTINSYLSANSMFCAVVYRADAMYWYINNFELPVASASMSLPLYVTLPVLFHAINDTTGPSSSTSFTSYEVTVADSNTSAQTLIADPIYPWRKATVDANGGLTASGLAISVTPQSTTMQSAGAEVVLNIPNANMSTCIVQFNSNAWIGTFQFLGTTDNSVWYPLQFREKNTNTYNDPTHTYTGSGSNGFRVYECTAIAGLVAVKISTTAYTSGYFNYVKIVAAPGSNFPDLGNRGYGINQVNGGEGLLGDTSSLVMNTDIHKARVSKTEFAMPVPVAKTPVANSWRELQKWHIPNTSPYYWFFPRMFNATITGAGGFIRAGEKTQICNWAANGTTAGTFTTGASALNQADAWSEVWVDVTTTNTSATTLTITHTDDTGVANTTTVSIPANSAVGARVWLTGLVQSNTNGLQSITNITSSSALASGAFTVWGFKTAAVVGSQTGAYGGSVYISEITWGHYTNGGLRYACIEYTATTTTANTFWGTITGVSTSIISVE